MKLFTKEINEKLFSQYLRGSDENQNVVVKIFNPYGAGQWFIMNSDPDDPEYLWGIVDLGYGPEMGSIGRSQLEGYRNRFGLGLERDISFDPMPAKDVFKGLLKGERFAKGGWTKDHKYLNKAEKHEVRYSQNRNRKGYSKSFFEDGGQVFDENQKMLINQNTEIDHHSDELEDILKGPVRVPAWVIAKMARANADLSDITHYLDGITEAEEKDDSVLEVEEGKVSSSEFGAEAFNKISGFLKGFNGIELKDDYTFEYEGKEYGITPLIKTDGGGVTAAFFEVSDDEGNKVGEMDFTSANDNKYFRANSELFGWKNNKFANGGYLTDPTFGSFQNTVFAKGGNISNRVKYLPKAKIESITVKDGSDEVTYDAKFIYNGYHHFSDGGKIEDEAFYVSKRNIVSVNLKSGDELKSPANGFWISKEAKKQSKPKRASSKEKGIVVTSIKDIPNFNQRLEEGKITYRGLGMGKLADDFYKKAGTTGTRIKVDGKEYFITDKEFDTFNRDENGKMRIRFDAPYRKYEDGGFMGDVYAGGGDISEAKIGNIRKNILGTISFEMAISGMRKPQDFSVYPIASDSDSAIITVQSSTRIGKIDLETGRGLMSKSHANGAYFMHLNFDPLTKFVLNQKDLETLRSKIISTAGDKVGGMGIVSDNSGATRLKDIEGSHFDNGGMTKGKVDGAFNKSVLYFWDKLGWGVDKIGKTEFDTILFQALIVSLTDANAHTDVLNFVKTLEKTKDTNKARKSVYFLPTQMVEEFGQEVSEKARWGVDKIIDAYIYICQMNGAHSTVKIIKENFYPEEKNMKYIPKAKIESITVKDGSDEVTYDAKFIYNGYHHFSDGGKIEEDAFYVSKRNVLSVNLKSGEKLTSPANGYWVDNDAKKTSEPKTQSSTPVISDTYLRKDTRGSWMAETSIDNFNGYDWRISTIKLFDGRLVSSAKAGKTEKTGTKGVQMFSYTMYQDPYHTLEVSKPKRTTEKVVMEQHEKAMAKFKKFMETGQFKNGGKISNFDKLSAKVAKEYVGQPVKSKYQEEYGKFYSELEAKEVGDKVAGKVKANQAKKMFLGGLFKSEADDYTGKEFLLKDGRAVRVNFKRGNTLNVTSYGGGDMPVQENISITEIDKPLEFAKGGKVSGKSKGQKQSVFALAKEIRKQGEAWKDAIKRAGEQISNSQ